MNQEVQLEVATLAGGCFWCIEGVFREVNGVENVVSGYTGGTTAKPTYDEVCTGKTGHAEAVQVNFNPSKISYREIFTTFEKVKILIEQWGKEYNQIRPHSVKNHRPSAPETIMTMATT